MSVKYKAYRVPLYLGYFIVIVSDSQKDIKRLIPQFDSGDKFYAECWNGNYRKERAYFIVLNDKCPSDKLTYGVMAHEALHCVNYIMRDVSILPDRDNDEASAYLIKWVMDKMMAQLREWKIKIGYIQ